MDVEKIDYSLEANKKTEKPIKPRKLKKKIEKIELKKKPIKF